MLFQPAIIALLLASGLGAALLLAAAPFALQVIRRWDIASGSELQLQLERRTYLFSTLLSFVFAIQLVALLLFIFNADRMAVMFVGAMCAVGTLNANAWGFPALIAQMAVFFLAAMWLAINHVDVSASDYPLVIVLGTVFASFGAFAALPDRWPRLRQLAFMLFMATFGLVCAALMFTPFHPDSDGTYRIGGIPGFAASAAMPWWARIVAGFFAIVCLGAAVLSAWGLFRGTASRDASDGDS
jgi:hypothetical protein